MALPPETANAAPESHDLLLVVDDEHFITQYVGAVLRKEGYEVLTARDAGEAWQLFEREGSRVRAVLTDMAMPGDWDGLELARHVRATSPTTPVLLMTGYSLAGSLGSLCELLPKPFTADTLRSAVRRMITLSSSLHTGGWRARRTGWCSASGK